MPIARAEHVWVTDVQVWGDRRAPGLLLAWEQREDGWWGHVIAVQLGIDAQGAGPYVKQAARGARDRPARVAVARPGRAPGRPRPGLAQARYDVAADELWVDSQMLEVRLSTLSRRERAWLDDQLAGVLI